MNGVCSLGNCDRPATSVVMGLSKSGRIWRTTCCDTCREASEAAIRALGFDLLPVEPLAS